MTMKNCNRELLPIRPAIVNHKIYDHGLKKRTKSEICSCAAHGQSRPGSCCKGTGWLLSYCQPKIRCRTSGDTDSTAVSVREYISGP